MLTIAKVLLFFSLLAFTSACRYVYPIYNSDTGEYVKSTCTLEIQSDYQDAERICRRLNMELFIAQDDDTQYDFEFSLLRLFDHFTWINGRRDNTGKWEAWIGVSTAAPLNLNLTSALNTSAHLNCLGYDGRSKSYTPAATKCHEIPSSSTITCEFKKKPVVNTDACLVQSVLDQKNVCIIGTLSNYHEADNYCMNKGMQLVSGNYNYALGVMPSNRLWINGWAGEGDWFVYDPIKKPIIANPAIDLTEPGFCLVAEETSAGSGTWKLKSAECFDREFFICEYPLGA